MSSLVANFLPSSSVPALSVENLSKVYLNQQYWRKNDGVQAVDDVSFEVQQGETLAIVGESGSGKSTLAKLIMRLEQPSSGRIRMTMSGEPQPIGGIAFRDYYSHVQMVFQDPYSSLNPRKKVWHIVSAPLRNFQRIEKEECRAIVAEALAKVGLSRQTLDMYPHNLSGGQRQRVGIARALVNNAKVLVLDEPLSSLDVSIQAQVINLLLDLQERLNLAYIFISHDLAVVRHIADNVAVMYGGRLVEYGPVDKVIGNPLHPYTKVLVTSSMGFEEDTDEDLEEVHIEGEITATLSASRGCNFASRCSKRTSLCNYQKPPQEYVQDRYVNCFHPLIASEI